MIIKQVRFKSGICKKMARGRNGDIDQSGVDIRFFHGRAWCELRPLTSRGKVSEACVMTVPGVDRGEVAAAIADVHPKVMALVIAMQHRLPVGTESPAVPHTVRMSGKLRVHSVQNLHAILVYPETGYTYQIHVDNIKIL